MDWESFYNNFRKPDFIPGFEIQNRLGGGAFGEVYKARKPSIAKAYAIKFLKLEDGASTKAIERELEQVKHFSGLDHPNLVTIEDMGVVMEVPYLVMGYAGEQTLAKRLRRGDLTPEQALSFFVQACRGVLALHDRRLVHFDLKPGNIFLHGDVARVGDYGLSKLMVEGRMTLSFGRGTPHYMAPEMLRGRADERADIYSLGVILFESLAGRVPYDAESSGGIVYREDDTPPEFPEDFPAELRAAVERCLRLAPEERFDDVAELLEALGQSARRGDSISFDPAQLPPQRRSVAREAATPKQRGGAVPEPGRSTARAELGQSADELRNTAAEFGRGAALVARGVWDGLKSAREQVPGGKEAGPDAPTPRPQAAGEFGGTRPSEAAPSEAAPSEATPSEPTGSGGVPPWTTSSATAAQATIPVPPAGSGAFAAVRTAVALAVELFFAILRGGWSWTVRSYAVARGRVDTRGSSRFWAFLRLGVFFLFLALLGGLIMGLVLFLLGEPLGL